MYRRYSRLSLETRNNNNTLTKTCANGMIQINGTLQIKILCGKDLLRHAIKTMQGMGGVFLTKIDSVSACSLLLLVVRSRTHSENPSGQIEKVILRLKHASLKFV